MIENHLGGKDSINVCTVKNMEFGTRRGLVLKER